jgi:drug/metabolite transporter (DMT)-like permease
MLALPSRHRLFVNFNILLLLVATLVWGTTFPLLKSASATLSGLEISTLRFLAASIVMLPFALKASRQSWRDGALLGIFALIAYITQAFGLAHISSNRSAFLTSLNVLMVPFLGLAFGRRLSAQGVLAAALACFGIGLLSWEGGGNWLGDGLTLLCALANAAYVLILSAVAPRNAPRDLTATQIVLMAVLGCLALPFAGEEALGSLPLRAAGAALPLLYLGLIASAGMLFLLAIAQREVSAEKAAVIYALEPVFAAVFSWLWLGETLGARGVVGGGLVVLAVIFSEWKITRAAPVAKSANTI